MNSAGGDNSNLKIVLFTHDTCVSKQEASLSVRCVSGPDYVGRGIAKVPTLQSQRTETKHLLHQPNCRHKKFNWILKKNVAGCQLVSKPGRRSLLRTLSEQDNLSAQVTDI